MSDFQDAWFGRSLKAGDPPQAETLATQGTPVEPPLGSAEAGLPASCLRRLLLTFLDCLHLPLASLVGALSPTSSLIKRPYAHVVPPPPQVSLTQLWVSLRLALSPWPGLSPHG